MKKNVLFLGGLFIVLLVIFLIIRSTEKKRLSEESIHEFFWADSSLIDSIAIKYGSWSYLYLENGRWQMAVDSELTYPASAADVLNVIRTTNEMVLTDLISVNPSKREKFNVDTIKGTVIQFFGGGECLSDFILGRIGQDFTHTYVRRQGSDSVFLAGGRFASMYSRAPPQWMDRQVYNFGPQELVQLRWKYPDQEMHLVRTEDGRYIISRDPDFTTVPGDSAESAYKFNYISTLTFSAFLPSGREGEASFDEVMLSLTAIDSAGTSHELIFTEDTTTATRIFAIRPGQPRPVGIFYRSSYDRLAARYETMLAPDTSGT